MNNSAQRPIDIVHKGLKRRYRSERRFRFMGLLAIIASLAFLSLLFISIIGNAYSALFQTHVKLNVDLEQRWFEGEELGNAAPDRHSVRHGSGTKHCNHCR